MFDYLEEPNAEPTSYNLDDQRFLTVFGGARMRTPFKAIPGTSYQPGYGFQTDERTGPWSPGVGIYGIALAGLPGVYFQHNLQSILFDLVGPFAKVQLWHNNTTDQTLQLPNATGTIALTNNIHLEIMGETPSGTVDGTNSVFVLANTPFSQSNSTTEIRDVKVFLNGLRTLAYSRSNATLTFATAPSSGSTLIVDYYQ